MIENQHELFELLTELPPFLFDVWQLSHSQRHGPFVQLIGPELAPLTHAT